MVEAAQTEVGAGAELKCGSNEDFSFSQCPTGSIGADHDPKIPNNPHSHSVVIDSQEDRGRGLHTLQPPQDDAGEQEEGIELEDGAEGDSSRRDVGTVLCGVKDEDTADNRFQMLVNSDFEATVTAWLDPFPEEVEFVFEALKVRSI
jgi:hypothetical protein